MVNDVFVECTGISVTGLPTLYVGPVCMLAYIASI